MPRAALLSGLIVLLAASAGAEFPEGETLEERQKWARERPDYKPFGIALSVEDRAKYVACEDDWNPSCDAMRERYQEQAAAAIGGDQLPDADLSVQQSWARQNAGWKPLGVPMSETDRNNYVICIEQPQWEGCAKIQEKYERVKEEEAQELRNNAAAPKPRAGGAAAAPRAGGDPRTSAKPDAGGADEGAAGEEVKGPPPGAEAAARARADGALGRARGLGDALKKELRDDDGGGPGGAGKSGKAGAAAPDEKELLLASSSNPGALAALGLVVGRDASGRPSFRRADGTPATAEDLDALRARLAAAPRALLRRPDFFSVLPRPRFEQLKADYRGRPELRGGVFRDIALSESERDFERSASCEGLSGECAPDAKESYRKGDLVPPEELAAIHRRLHGDPDEDFIDEGPGDDWETEAAVAGAEAFDSAAPPAAAPSRGRAVLRAVERLTGGGAAPKDTTGGPGAAKAAALAWGEVPGAAIEALERGRGGMSIAGAVLFLLAAGLLLRRST